MEAEHELIWDPGFSTVSGVNVALTVSHLQAVAQDKIAPHSLADEQTLGGLLLGASYRLAKGILLDSPWSQFETVVVHEVFGHGARAREFGGSPTYDIGWPAPYGSGGGKTRPGFARSITLHERNALFIAGIEGSQVVSTELVETIVLKRSMSYREGLRCIRALADLFENLQASQDGRQPRSDTENYVYGLNRLYATSDNSAASVARIKRHSWVHLMNPFLAYAVFSIAHYGFTSSPENSVPMLHLGSDARYLPWFRYRYTPYGPEYVSEHIVSTPNGLVHLSLFRDDQREITSWGASALVLRALDWRDSYLSVSGTLWSQPPLVLEVQTIGLMDARRGGSCILKLVSRLTSWAPHGYRISSSVALGYKSNGFVEGEELSEGPILRLGLSLSPESKSRAHGGGHNRRGEERRW